MKAEASVTLGMACATPAEEVTSLLAGSLA